MAFSKDEYLKQLSDSELLAIYKKNGDKLLIGELYKRYTHLVLGMCLHYFNDKDVAKDVVVQIFEKLFDELKKREVENFKSWLSFVVRNFCISELRKMKTQLNRDIQYQYEVKQELRLIDESEAADHEKKLAHLELALQNLNP